MTAKIQIVKSADFNSSQLAIKTGTADSIEIRYNGRPFYLNTGILECAHGIDHAGLGHNYGTILLELPEGSVMSSVLEELDRVARVICAKKSQTLFGESLADQAEMPYWPLLTAQGFKLLINSNVSIFGADGIKLDSATQLNSRFTASFLVAISGLALGKDGKLKWEIAVKQIKIDEASSLPPGCLIVDTEEEVNDELAARSHTTFAPAETLSTELGVVDTDRNELLD